MKLKIYKKMKHKARMSKYKKIFFKLFAYLKF